MILLWVIGFVAFASFAITMIGVFVASEQERQMDRDESMAFGGNDD